MKLTYFIVLADILSSLFYLHLSCVQDLDWVSNCSDASANQDFMVTYWNSHKRYSIISNIEWLPGAGKLTPESWPFNQFFDFGALYAIQSRSEIFSRVQPIENVDVVPEYCTVVVKPCHLEIGSFLPLVLCYIVDLHGVCYTDRVFVFICFNSTCLNDMGMFPHGESNFRSF